MILIRSFYSDIDDLLQKILKMIFMITHIYNVKLFFFNLKIVKRKHLFK